jgi:hypothetical protein
MRLTSSLFAATLLLTVSTFTAFASPITYTETFTGSGILDGVNFTNQLVTLTGVGDTADVTLDPFGDFLNPVAATVQIGSGSVDPFTDSIEVFANMDSAGFGDSTRGGLFIDSAEAALFDTYELQSAVTGTGGSAYNPGHAYTTALGSFEITAIPGDSTFSATLPTAVTPEPSTFVLLVTGIIGLAETARRKFLSA